MPRMPYASRRGLTGRHGLLTAASSPTTMVALRNAVDEVRALISRRC
jgi:hypothetical protein